MSEDNKGSPAPATELAPYLGKGTSKQPPERQSEESPTVPAGSPKVEPQKKKQKTKHLQPAKTVTAATPDPKAKASKGKKIVSSKKVKQKTPKVRINEKQLQPVVQPPVTYISEDELLQLLQFPSFCDKIPAPSWCKAQDDVPVERVILITIGKPVELNLYKTQEFSTRLSEDFEKKVQALADRIHQKEIPNDPVIKKFGVDKVSVMDCLATRQERLQCGFPTEENEKFINYVTFKSCGITNDSPLYSVDCEMVRCVGKDKKLYQKLAKVSVVDANGHNILDELVKPNCKIVDYVTRFSGITEDMMDPVKTTLEDVQKMLMMLLPQDSILVGHSLNCDLRALEIIHSNVIDSSLLYARPGNKRFSLKFLTKHVLGKDIQTNENAGHNCTEDAIAALRLVQFFITQGPLKVAELSLEGKSLQLLPSLGGAKEGSKSGGKRSSKYLETWDIVQKCTTSTFNFMEFQVSETDLQTLTEVAAQVEVIHAQLRSSLCMVLMPKTSERSGPQDDLRTCYISAPWF